MNLSPGGAAVRVPLEVEQALAEGRVVEVSFRLPGEEHAAEFVARVRHRRGQGPAVHYGLEFDQDASSDFETSQERVTAYVMQRLGGERVQRAA